MGVIYLAQCLAQEVHSPRLVSKDFCFVQDFSAEMHTFPSLLLCSGPFCLSLVLCFHLVNIDSSGIPTPGISLACDIIISPAVGPTLVPSQHLNQSGLTREVLNQDHNEFYLLLRLWTSYFFIFFPYLIHFGFICSFAYLFCLFILRCSLTI